MLHKEPKKPVPSEPAAAPGPPADDEMSRRLRESISRKRPWQRTYFVLLFLFVIGIVALGYWWIWLRGDSPELMVIGFDQVTKPGKTVTIRAATMPHKPGVERWGGRPVVFQEIAPPLAEAEQPISIVTDQQGLAQTAWKLKHPSAMAEIEAIYIDDAMRPPWYDRSRCRIFIWPPDARLLVLDVEPTLKKTDNWPALSKALADASNAGWRIVYLAVDADTPATYRPLRDWVLRQIHIDQAALPNGPVLGRHTLFTAEADAAARKKVLAELKADFPGPLFLLTAEGGLKMQAVDPAGDLQGEPIGLAGWDKLAVALPK